MLCTKKVILMMWWYSGARGPQPAIRKSQEIFTLPLADGRIFYPSFCFFYALSLFSETLHPLYTSYTLFLNKYNICMHSHISPTTHACIRIYIYVYTSRIITSNPYVFKTCRHSYVRFKTDRMLKDKFKKSVGPQ